MGDSTRYVHTSIVSRDWRRLAQFYERVLCCTPLAPERDLSGTSLEAGTGIPGARIRGVHLRLPGYGEDGPTLEIFQYDPMEAPISSPVNRPGLAHIAFVVDDVARARDAVLKAGGGSVGEIVTLEVEGSGRVTFAYVRDPERNIVELQSWS